MLYVIDTSALIDMFDNYYPSRFPSLWELFDSMVAAGNICSVREAFHEIQSYQVKTSRLVKWARANPDFFQQPTEAEAECVARIFSVSHFQHMISRKKLIAGGYVADPFVIAKALVQEGIVVCQEKLKEHAARIPNVCRYFGVECVDIEGFMERENWVF